MYFNVSAVLREKSELYKNFEVQTLITVYYEPFYFFNKVRCIPQSTVRNVPLLLV